MNGNGSIIGLHGDRGVGKDTVADMLVKDYGFTKLAFADALRDEVAVAWGCPMILLTTEQKNIPTGSMAVCYCTESRFALWYSLQAECITEISHGIDWMRIPRTPRWAAQRWADFQKRWHVNHFYYVDKMQDRIDVLPGKDIVISDVRLDFEADFVRSRPGVLGVVHIVRPDQPARTDHHSSDEPLMDAVIDYTLVNDSGLAALALEVDIMLTKLLYKALGPVP